MGVRARLCCPHWACLGPNLTSVSNASTQDQVAHAKPNLRPNVFKLHGAPVGLKLGPRVGANWPEFGVSKLGPSGLQLGPTQGAKDGQV